MPLSIEVNKIRESTDCQYVLLQDNTGVYNAGTNPNGYGAPNLARADIALFLVPRIYDSPINDTTKLLASKVISGNDDPLNATEWILEVDTDAYYACDIAWVFPADPGFTAVNTGDYVYDTNLQKLYRSTIDANNIAPNDDLTNWIEGSINDDEFDTFLDSSDQKSQVDFIIVCRTENAYQKFTAQYTKNILNNPNTSSCPCMNKNKHKWERLHVLYNGAIVLDKQNRHIEAGDVLKVLSDLITGINCENCKC